MGDKAFRCVASRLGNDLDAKAHLKRFDNFRMTTRSTCAGAETGGHEPQGKNELRFDGNYVANRYILA